MFEDAELGHTVSREEYATRSGALRDALLQAQYALKDARKFPVIVLIGGVQGSDSIGLSLSHRPVDVFTPGVLALAIMSTSFTSLAIATGFEQIGRAHV